MARTQQIQQPAIARTVTTRGGPTRSKGAMAVLGASALAAFWALAMLTTAGQVFYVYSYVYLEFYAGVVALVSLSITVMAGVLATDRLVLLARHRVLLQSAHRTTGIIAVSTLALHILTKVSSGRAGATDVVIPFVSQRGLYVGLGTIAAYLMVSTLWTGLIRARFVGRGKPWMWRALHSTAYASWPVALTHGLNAGRAPAAWVTLSYLFCVFLVVVALLVRLSVSLGRKRKDQGQTTGSIKPVGRTARDSAESRTVLAGATPGSDVRVSWAEPANAGNLRVGRAEQGVTRRSRTDTAARSDESSGRRSRRFVVPEVPQPGTIGADPATDSPRYGRRWSARTDTSTAPTTRRRDERERDYLDDDRGTERDYRPRRSLDAEIEAEYQPRRGAADEELDRDYRPRRRADDDVDLDYRPRRQADDDADLDYRPRRRADDDDERDYRPRRGSAEPEPVVDDTPTLVNLDVRRALRAASTEGGTGSGRSGRRGKKASGDSVDEAYWRELRGEAK
ncbi:hypothetical protein BDK92_1809 [Micromonospora pisi]|uniref:DMSO/TMAO reductase YedYZ heme-binding membrane subunit n=1 Tax=Micromonospora pisi TaxID=589240 RepID=A0A495JEU8_9ACTN|nr:ferric reductase-like transmembrane domain-containing protein [Micromonospora pisi]RKR87530.1 hypothetical protein BDK92_1809 [Micromonospora pisi]